MQPCAVCEIHILSLRANKTKYCFRLEIVTATILTIERYIAKSSMSRGYHNDEIKLDTSIHFMDSAEDVFFVV